MISVIVVNYNCKDYLRKCIDSLLSQTYKDIEIIIVDNASTDDSLNFLNNYSHSEQIKLIKSKENVGFATGNNLGLKHTQGDFILLINPDCTLEARCLEYMVEAFISSNDNFLKAVMPVIYKPDGSLEAFGALYNDIGHYYSYLPEHLTETKNLGITPCCVLLKKDIFTKTHLFEERYFMYYEEMEFTIRFFLLGFHNLATPKAIVYHAGSKSVETREGANATYFKQAHANPYRLHTFLKYYPSEIILRNLLKLLLSLLYWEYVFVRNGKLKVFVVYNLRLLRFSYLGLIERFGKTPGNSDLWVKYIKQTTFSELLNTADKLYPFL